MSTFILFATPWYVNLLPLLAIFLLWYYRTHPLALTRSQLITAALFGTAFGFVEASVVIYLRAALGFLPGYMGTLSDVIHQATLTNYQQVWAATSLPNSLMAVEFFRETAAIIMLMTTAFIASNKMRERCALFLWAFAFWDLFYYFFLWLTVRWPYSLLAQDVLFLIPVPWVAQVWFPILVDALVIIAIAINRQNWLGKIKQ